MDNRQQSILATFALVVTGLGAALVTAYAVSAPLEHINSQTALGRSFYRFVEDFTKLQGLVGPISLLLIAGLGAIQGSSAGRRYFNWSALALIVGLAASAALLYFVAFTQFGEYIALNAGSDIAPEDFRRGAYPFLGWTLGAFASGLAVLLSVSRLTGNK